MTIPNQTSTISHRTIVGSATGPTPQTCQATAAALRILPRLWPLVRDASAPSHQPRGQSAKFTPWSCQQAACVRCANEIEAANGISRCLSVTEFDSFSTGGHPLSVGNRDRNGHTTLTAHR
jgi:hypothetical protein